MMKKTKLSFELFPPKLSLSRSKLQNTWCSLNNFMPQFFSVTFGAGGANSQDKTVNLVNALCNEKIRVAPHITGIGMKYADVDGLLNHYLARGIRDLVVIRGDLPETVSDLSGDFKYAKDIVGYIRNTTGQAFDIKVAAYPECHPEAKNLQADLHNLKLKAEAGANCAITQYFFEAELYFNFVERCQKLGLTLPIIPGIMPIANYEKIVKFSQCCGATIPNWLDKRMQAYPQDCESRKQVGIEIITQLCEKLIQFGVPGLHIYTLNQVEPSMAILKNLAI